MTNLARPASPRPPALLPAVRGLRVPRCVAPVPAGAGRGCRTGTEPGRAEARAARAGPWSRRVRPGARRSFISSTAIGSRIRSSTQIGLAGRGGRRVLGVLGLRSCCPTLRGRARAGRQCAAASASVHTAMARIEHGCYAPFGGLGTFGGRRTAGKFNALRYRITLEDEMDAKRTALSHRRRSRGDKDLMLVRHMVWLERAEREAKELALLQVKERAEREAAERERQAIHCLPEELMLSIFSLLELEELARSVVPVCSRWRRLGRDESLWAGATLRYDPTAESADDFIRALLTAPALGTLEYITDGAPTREDVAKALTKCCQRVTTLRMLPGPPENVLWIVLDRLAEHLRHLELFVTDLSVLACIGGMDNLLSLTLHGEISFVTDKLSRLGSGCAQLTELDLGGLRFNDIYRLDLLIADVVLGHTETLTVLKLPPSMTSAIVMDAVADCRKLKVLAIWITPHITSSVLTASLQRLGQLESLTWRNYDAWLDKAELAHFILQSQRFPQLKEFRLLDCIDMDDGLALALAHRAHGLARLSLHRSELSARGLAEIMQRAHELTSLDLYKNASVAEEHLEMVASHLHKLRLLDVRGCCALRTLGEDVWEALRASLPDLDIRFD
ncbi:F-box/LRR-repeat protein 14 [Frankliniella fusca]|uniref:F-box/LRR-repeat protein 14 n=1 Tax=Frankliniella fusca TaxID=407009 RepID=A0AAE1HP72_9NEOP|nr:F-box/LRR-repeat protein 14 [Frankliniella fusca]